MTKDKFICPNCRVEVNIVCVDNNVQTVWADEKGYEFVNGFPVGLSGKYNPVYYHGRQERHYSCGCVF